MGIEDDLEDLKKKLEEGQETGWSHTTGQSPLKENLQTMVGLLGQMKGEMEKERDKKVKVLQKMLKHQAQNSKYRVNRKK